MAGSPTAVAPPFKSQTTPTPTDDDPLRPPKRPSTYHNETWLKSPGRSMSAPVLEKKSQPSEESDVTKKSKQSSSQDAFEATGAEDEAPELEITRASIDLDELPIELISLTDSFVESLFAKVHPVPPNMENVSHRFQEFYSIAASHIQTHTAALAVTFAGRNISPARSISSRASSTASRLRAKATSLGSKDRPKLLALPGLDAVAESSPKPTPAATTGPVQDQQMITADELAARKRMRRGLEQKRILFEEAVERRLCEGIYGKIYRHRSTQDEAQDEKLRSKTAALAVVGIGLKDLGVDMGDAPMLSLPEGNGSVEAVSAASQTEGRVEEIKEWLDAARRHLVAMHEKRYPLGKLNQLKAAHKSIVDTLSHFHPSSSADEIMPMLIYTLITLPPENINVISDAQFIQRFRWSEKLTGEAAYCLTNLEAAISFLDNVDLSTLREDEPSSGPPKPAAGTETDRPETFPPAYNQAISVPLSGSAETKTGLLAGAADKETRPKPLSTHSRRISDLVNTPAQALNAASDAVLTTADQSLKNISYSLDTSYRFLFGRLLERNQNAAAAAAAAAASASSSSGPQATNANVPRNAATLVVPKTLEDARKLVSTPPPTGDDDEGGASGASSVVGSVVGTEDAAESVTATATAPDGGNAGAGSGGFKTRPAPREDRVMNLIGGWRPSRDHSADSTRSATSLRRVLFAEDAARERTRERQTAKENEKDKDKDKAATGGPAASPGSGQTLANPAMLESMRNFGQSFNPMARLSSIGMMRGFGRSGTAPSPTVAVKETTIPPMEDGESSAGMPLPLAKERVATGSQAHISPPIKRFMELTDPGDLRVSEMADLLRDYRRLAFALSERGAFGDESGK